MSTFTEVLPKRKSSKHSALAWEPDYQRPGCGRLTIHTARCSCAYRVTWFASDFPGSAFHVEKEGAGSDREAEGYDVFVGLAEKLCGCRGFLSAGHCKHVDAIEALIANGWDRMSLANPEADVSSTDAPF